MDEGGTPAAHGFRSDINGLRAVAIALVVAYHLAGPLAPGGFIGVDVFFVISGFLMTNVIVGSLRDGRFDLWRFYLARLRRIWPALVALCMALWVAGATLIDPWTLQHIAADIPGALAFVSNAVFAGRRGYFTPDERVNWLLHTWSLSLEWQFYLLYPLLLLALFAAPILRRRVWRILAGLTVASFTLAAVLSHRGVGWSFYLLPTRGWELLAGALCAGFGGAALGTRSRIMLHGCGVALIGAGALVAVPGAGWPSVVALLPVGGAALVIVGGLTRTVWAENPVVAGVGRASYSIYLWHWPVVVALRYMEVPLSWPVALAAITAMLGLGFASYFLIERAATRWVFGRPWRWGLGLAAAGGVAALAFAAERTDGFERLRTAGAAPAERAAMADLRTASDDWTYPVACGRQERAGRLTLCRIGDRAARQVLVIGDSHAEQIAPRYAHAFDGQPGRGLTLVTAGGCPPAPGVGLRNQGGVCARWAGDAFRLAETAGYRRVVIVSAWTVYFDPRPGALLGMICLANGTACAGDPPTQAVLADQVFDHLAAEIVRLRQRGIEVVLMQPTPQSPRADPLWLYRRLLRTHDPAAPALPRTELEQSAALERTRLASVAARTGAVLVEPLDALCPGGPCPIEDGGHALFKDAWHYRGSAVTQPRFAYLDPWLAPAPMRLK